MGRENIPIESRYSRFFFRNNYYFLDPVRYITTIVYAVKKFCDFIKIEYKKFIM